MYKIDYLRFFHFKIQLGFNIRRVTMKALEMSEMKGPY